MTPGRGDLLFFSPQAYHLSKAMILLKNTIATPEADNPASSADAQLELVK